MQVILVACTERSRLNPLDPQNPQTGGKPTGLRVISDLDTVRLRWNTLAIRDLPGFNVYRKLPAENEFSLIGQTSAPTNVFEDLSDRYGVLHSYRITARVAGLETPPSEEATITPGPTVVWVADIDNRAVIKLTHDGRHEILRSRAFIDPFRLKVDKRRGTVWVLEDFSGNFGRLDQNGQLLGISERFFEAVGLALDAEDGSIWVGDNNEKRVWHFDREGTRLARLDSLPEFSALAFNPFVEELWVATTNGEQLLRIKKNSAQIQRVNLQPSWSGPVRDLAIVETTGEAWMAAGDRVVRLNANGEVALVTTEEFTFAARVAIDQASGACWVLDDVRQFLQSRVIKLEANGQVQLRLEGFDRPQGLAVNPFDASCYVLDTLQGRLVKISSEGTITVGYANLLTPLDIDIVMPGRP